MNAAALVVNSKFKVPLNIVLHGLDKHNFIYDIIIFYDEYFKELDDYVKVYRNLKIKLKKINVDKYVSLKFVNLNRNWEINPFYRYEIFQLSEYNKILYLDLDIIILSNINSIFNIEGDFCAVELAKVTNLAYVPLGQRGFNAGVMLISNKHLNLETQNDLIQLSSCNYFNGNQKPLNMYFANRVSFLDYKFNLTTDLLTLERIDVASIIHFIGDKKPWECTGLNAFCDYVRKISGDYLIIKTYNMFLKEYREAMQRLIL